MATQKTNEAIPSKQTAAKKIDKTILIVEDETYLREVLRDKLNYTGFKTLEASNGKEGYQLALRQKPDLILLDLLMPVMNGIEMIKKLSTDHWGANVPIIIMTNVNDLKTIISMMHYKINITEKAQNAYPVNSDFAIKIYLEAILGNNLYDYIVKTNYKLNDLITKIKKVFSEDQNELKFS